MPRAQSSRTSNISSSPYRTPTRVSEVVDGAGEDTIDEHPLPAADKDAPEEPAPWGSSPPTASSDVPPVEDVEVVGPVKVARAVEIVEDIDVNVPVPILHVIMSAIDECTNSEVVVIKPGGIIWQQSDRDYRYYPFPSESQSGEIPVVQIHIHGIVDRTYLGGYAEYGITSYYNDLRALNL